MFIAWLSAKAYSAVFAGFKFLHPTCNCISFYDICVVHWILVRIVCTAIKNSHKELQRLVLGKLTRCRSCSASNFLIRDTLVVHGKFDSNPYSNLFGHLLFKLFSIVTVYFIFIDI